MKEFLYELSRALPVLAFGFSSAFAASNLSVAEAKSVANMSPDQAEKYIPLLGETEGDARTSLIYSLGAAGVEKARPVLLDIAENSPDDFESLVALWSIEKLPKSSDAQTLNALFNCSFSAKPRSVDYAMRLMDVQEGEGVPAFLKAKIESGNISEAIKAGEMAFRRGDTELQSAVFAKCAESPEFANAVLDGLPAFVTKGFYPQLLALAKNYGAVQRLSKQLAAAAFRLGEYDALYAFLNGLNDSGDASASRIIEMLPPKVPLYAMCTSFLDWSKGEQISDEKIRLVARLGFSGIQPELGRVGDFNGVQGKFTAMRMADLRLNALFVGCFADEDGITLPPMETLMLYCRPFSSALWLSISYGNTKTPDRAKIVESIRQIAKECERNGVDLIIYPHEGNYIDNAAAAIELASESGCGNVFVTYNLIHEYWYAKRVAKNMDMAEPGAMAKFVLDNPEKVKIVTVNGINSDDWICPLGSGDFDTEKFAHAIVDGGYNGVIGLQGFGTWGLAPIEDALAMSMKTWKEWFAK